MAEIGNNGTAYGFVTEILRGKLSDLPENAGEQSAIIEQLGASSLDIVIMLSEAEDMLGIEIPDEDILGIKTVGDAAKYISLHTGMPLGFDTEESEAPAEQ